MLKSLMITGIAASVSLVAGVAQARVSDADKAFLTQDIQGSRYELALAKLGSEKATKPAIRQFSQMVVHDHEKANAALMTLAKEKGVTAPGGMTSDDQQRLSGLRGMQGSAFDTAYIDEQSRINTQDKQDSDKEKMTTDDTQIKSYIAKFAATDAKHKKMAEQLKSSS